MRPERLRIAIVIDSLYTGGAEYSTLLWVSWLKKMNQEVRLVCLKEKEPEYDSAEHGLEVHRLQPGSLTGRYRQLKALIHEYQPDIVHSILSASNFLCRLVRLGGNHFIHIESLVNQPYRPERLQDQHLQTWKVRMLQTFDRFTQDRGVQHFHANSKAVAAHYRNAVGVPDRKMTIIHRGRFQNRFLGQRNELRAQYRESLDIPETNALLINVGRHEFQKGQDTLIRAVHLLQRRRIPCTLIIAGREGASTPVLQEMISVLRLEGQVKLLGHRNDVEQLLVASDIFVFPSRYEGLPGALVEACAAGLPVVCSDVDSICEVVIPGANACLCEKENANAMAQCVSRLCDDEDLRAAYGQKSLEIFEENFNIENIHRSMHAMYRRLLMVS